jgi:hypothetical protein
MDMRFLLVIHYINEEIMMMTVNGKNYDFVESFLLQFNPNCYYDENDKALTEEAAIEMYLSNPYETKEGLEILIAECHEVLALDPFPWEQIDQTINRLFWNEKLQKWESKDSAESYHQWLTMVTDMLETEAKRQGKL